MVVLFGFLFVTVSSRITGVIGSSSNPISGMTIATLLLDLPDLRHAGLGRPAIPPGRPVDRRRRLHRLVQRRHDLARPEDRLPRRRHALEAAGRRSWSGHSSRPWSWADTALAQRGLHDRRPSVPEDLPSVKADVSKLTADRGGQGRQHLQGLVGGQPGAGRLAGQVPGRRDRPGRSCSRPGNRRAAQLLDLRAPRSRSSIRPSPGSSPPSSTGS